MKRVIFMNIGWFIHVDDDFLNEKKKIEFLLVFTQEENVYLKSATQMEPSIKIILPELFIVSKARYQSV